MTITNGYATLAECKLYMATRGLAGSVGTDASDDSVIEDLIEAASRYADSHTGRRFYADASDGTYYYQAQDIYTVELPDYKSITSVSVDFSNTRTYTALTVDTDFDLLPDNYTAEGIPINGLKLSPLSSYWFPTQRKAIKIVGKRGWPSVPDDIKEAVLETVVSVYSARSGQSNSGRISITAAGVVIRPDDVPEFAMAIFKSYRLMT